MFINSKFYLYNTIDIGGKPVEDGLFCEKIFGPIKDRQCHCKTYKNIQRKPVVKKFLSFCPVCKIQITDSNIRNYRMGYCGFYLLRKNV